MRSRRQRAAATPARRRTGPSVGVIAGIIVPILFLVIGTGFIFAALEDDDDPEVVLEPPAALVEGGTPVNETAPPPMPTPPPATTVPVPDTTAVLETTVPPATTVAPETTVPTATTALSGTTSPEVAQAFAIAEQYLAAIVSGDLATAVQLRGGAVTEAELADAFPGIVAGRAELIEGGPTGPTGVPLRLLLVTEHDLEGEPDTALTCVRWDVNAGLITEVFSEELDRVPGSVSEPKLVQTKIDCAVLPIG
jgi:hypothetical protein